MSRMQSIRAAAALTACVSAPALAVAGATAAHAAGMTPEQAQAVEQQVAPEQVPFTVPLGGLFEHITGKPSSAGVQGAIPASPLAPPTTAGQGAGPDLVPDPLVPPLQTGDRTPALDLSAPLPTTTGTLADDAAHLGLPAAPVHGLGAGLGLGHPVSYDGPGMTRAMPADQTLPQLDLDHLAPAVQAPTMQTSPGGRLSVDQKTSDASLLQPLDGVIASANGALHQAG
ncbi:hypothetical protein ACFQZC_21710 [Streptacidiphilus monticola]